MNDKIYVVKGEELQEVLSISKVSGVILYNISSGQYRNSELGGFSYQCNDCGAIQPIIQSYKKINRPYGERLCKSCCRKGERNPFYGKKHPDELKIVMRERCREQSIEKWKDSEYRDKVIKGVSKPRREGFKQEQSDRITQWYKDNPNQRSIRSDIMKQTWKDGRIEPNIHSINKSKGEHQLYQYLLDKLPNYNINNKETIRLGRRWFFPDIIINNKLIVEYFGNYWHGNPLIYESTDVVNHKVTAEQMWEKDKKRVDTLVNMGYSVLIVWADEEYWVNNTLVNNIKELL